MTLSPGKFRGLSRLADRHGRFKMLAVDQRPPIEGPVKAVRGGDIAMQRTLQVAERPLARASSRLHV